MPYLPGEPAADADSLDLQSVAADVGGFLGSLHTTAPPDAPVNPFRGVPLANRAEALAANLRLVPDQVDTDAVQRAWAGAIAAPAYAGPPLWLHGDLHPAALWTRARGWALNLAIAFLAHSADNPQIMTVGRRTLQRVLVDN